MKLSNIAWSRKYLKRNRKILDQNISITKNFECTQFVLIILKLMIFIVPTLPSILNVDTSPRTNEKSNLLIDQQRSSSRLHVTPSLLNSTQEEFNRIFSPKSMFI